MSFRMDEAPGWEIPRNVFSNTTSRKKGYSKVKFQCLLSRNRELQAVVRNGSGVFSHFPDTKSEQKTLKIEPLVIASLT